MDEVSGSIKHAPGEIPLLEATGALDDGARVGGVEESREECVRVSKEPVPGERERVTGQPVSSVEVPEGTGSRVAVEQEPEGEKKEGAAGQVVPVAPGAVTIKPRKVCNAGYSRRSRPV